MGLSVLNLSEKNPLSLVVIKSPPNIRLSPITRCFASRKTMAGSLIEFCKLRVWSGSFSNFTTGLPKRDEVDPYSIQVGILDEFASTGLLLFPDRSAHKLILPPARKSSSRSSRPSLFISMASSQSTSPGMESAKRFPNPIVKVLLIGGAAKKRSFPG